MLFSCLPRLLQQTERPKLSCAGATGAKTGRNRWARSLRTTSTFELLKKDLTNSTLSNLRNHAVLTSSGPLEVSLSAPRRRDQIEGRPGQGPEKDDGLVFCVPYWLEIFPCQPSTLPKSYHLISRLSGALSIRFSSSDSIPHGCYTLRRDHLTLFLRRSSLRSSLVLPRRSDTGSLVSIYHLTLEN
ncbi:hypothetical protein BDY24DRAFT_43623 [Mrakia frigida]|uniref:uncharacterized protein n=1 Tax=Mrakia frigida TaxID=29902 RepID=UPI003FCC0FB2